MLQQTQVPRVMEKYREFLRAFPTVRALAKAPLSDVLKVWSGMGYNRRGKFLRDAAVAIVEHHGGRVPKDAAILRTLPGIGPYTASAVRVFAFNQPDVLIETNVRTAVIHAFLQGESLELVSDRDVAALAQKVAEGQDPRTWQSALFDYGAYLKRSGIRLNARSANYTKQSPFEGSLRQIRGAILRELHANRPVERLPFTKKRLAAALASLSRDGLITKRRGKWSIV